MRQLPFDRRHRPARYRESRKSFEAMFRLTDPAGGLKFAAIRQHVRENRTRRFIAGVAGVQRDRFLVKSVAQEKRVDQAAWIPAIEHSVAGAQTRSCPAGRASKQNRRAGANSLAVGRYAAGCRIIRIGHGGLRQSPSNRSAGPGSTSGAVSLCTDPARRSIVLDGEIHNGVADGLRERRPVFRACRLPVKSGASAVKLGNE